MPNKTQTKKLIDQPDAIAKIYQDNWKLSEFKPDLFIPTYISPDPDKPMRPTFEQSRFMNAMITGEYEEGWFAGGNSAGKTWCAKFIGAHWGSYKIKPGKPWETLEQFENTPYNILCTGPENKQAMELWEAIEESFKNSPFLRYMVKEAHTGSRRKMHPHIILENGVFIEAVGLGEKGKHIEGQAYDLILVNEPADVKYLTHCLERVLVPRTWRRGGVIMGFGTPKGKNEYYLAWRKGQKELAGIPNPHHDARVYSQYADSRTNPYASQEKIAQLLDSDNEKLIEERIKGQFVDSQHGAFKDSQLDRITKGELPTKTPGNPSHVYVSGVDFGRKNDHTVCITMDISIKPNRIVNYYRAGGGMTTWETIFDDLLNIHREYGGEFVIDSTGMAGDMQSDSIFDLGIPYIAYNSGGSASKKVKLINTLQNAIAKGTFIMPYYRQLLEELQMYPGDMQDKAMETDSVMALALCLQGLETFGNIGTIESYNR